MRPAYLIGWCAAILALLSGPVDAQYWRDRGQGNVLITGGTFSGVGKDTMTSDAAARSTTLAGANAYPQATVNTTGGNFYLSPGIGRRFITVVDYSLIDAGADTITITVNGTANVGTATAATQDATNFIVATSNAVTATNICTWADQLAGVTATAVGASCYLTADATTYALTLATTMAAGEGTVTSGTDGNLIIYSGTGTGSQLLGAAGSASTPSFGFVGQAGTGIYNNGGNIAFSYGNTLQLQILSGSYGLQFGAAADVALTRYAAKQVMISGDGVGATTNAGWILGYGGSSGYSAFYPSTQTPGPTTYSLIQDGSNVYLNALAATGEIGLRAAGVSYATFSGASGKGGYIIAGAATTDVNALNITQTWNAAGVTFSGVKIAVTDTASAAGSLVLNMLGGASGTTTIATFAKNGQFTIYADRNTIAPYQFVDTGASGHTWTMGAITGAGAFDFRNTTLTGAPVSFQITGIASGVNYLKVYGGATTVGPTMVSEGETNVPLNLSSKGTGAVSLNATGAGSLNFGSGIVAPAASGTRYLCISTTGVVTSSAAVCSGT